MTQDLQARLEQLAKQPRRRTLSPPRPTPSCNRCEDHGVVEMIGGTYTTPNGLTLTATEQCPIYVPCRCRHQQPKRPNNQQTEF